MKIRLTPTDIEALQRDGTIRKRGITLALIEQVFDEPVADVTVTVEPEPEPEQDEVSIKKKDGGVDG